MISGKGVHMFHGVGVRFADFLFFLKYPMETKLFHFHRIIKPNYFIFIEYLKNGVTERGGGWFEQTS